MDTLTGYNVEELFVAIEDKIKEVKELWKSNQQLNRDVFELNILMLDLAEALDVDFEKEMNRATAIVDYINTRIKEDMGNGVFD